MKNILIFFLGALICICCKALNKTNTSISQELTTALYSSKNDLFNDIQVYLLADTVQKQTEKGLNFSIKLINKSAESKTIVNPLDLFTISLLDIDGNNILYPYIPKIHYRRRDNSLFSFETFNVRDVKIDNEVVKTDLSVATNIILPAKSSYEIFLSITKVLPPDIIAKPYTFAQTQNLPMGKYQLLIEMSLMIDKESKSLTLKPQFINYGIKQK